MINKPSVDKLVEVTGDRYALCTVVSKRARQMIEHQLSLGESINGEPISDAAQEVMDGKLKIQKD